MVEVTKQPENGKGLKNIGMISAQAKVRNSCEKVIVDWKMRSRRAFD
jgi:hypothetical protein